MLQPDTNAWIFEAALISLHPKWAATRDEEHAVSIVMQAPVNPKTKEMRPDATLKARPVAL
jgi:hypothetical protein